MSCETGADLPGHAAVPVYLLGPELSFPAPEQAGPEGLLAVGGDLEPERLLRAYALGIFPWYSEGEPIQWFSPDPRMVLRASELHVSRRLARTLRTTRLQIRLDTAFDQVIRSCARVPRREQGGTWITEDMIRGYSELHDLGFAHSAEAWLGDRLVGGVYGVSLGSWFFGESMFAIERDASKIALVALVRQLEAWGLPQIDCQVFTGHLARLGARHWPRSRFLRELEAGLRRDTRRGAWCFDVELIPGDPAGRT